MKIDRQSNLLFSQRPAFGEMKFVVSLVLATAMFLTLSTGAWATLIDRGGGLIYDDVQDITWLQDANLAATNAFGVSGINPDGTMSWNTAQAWIAAMNAAAYLGFSDWRLPTTPDAGGPFVFGWDGVQPYGYTYGYNMTTSEMGYMFYVNLGNVGLRPTNYNGGSVPDRAPGTFGLMNVGPFQNFGQPFPNTLSIPYWSGTQSVFQPADAWYFDFYFGNLNPGEITGPLNNQFYAWAVRDGDVPTSVDIDIKPGSNINPINRKSKGKIPVAILSTSDFDARKMVDRTSLTFGATGDEDSLAFCTPRRVDINGDHLKGLICHFYTKKTGFQCGDTEGILKGQLLDGTPIEGSDLVRIVPCK